MTPPTPGPSRAYVRALGLARALARLAGGHHGGCLLHLVLVSLVLGVVFGALRRGVLAAWWAPLALGLGISFVALSPLMSSPQFWLGVGASGRERWDAVALAFAWVLALAGLGAIAVLAIVMN